MSDTYDRIYSSSYGRDGPSGAIEQNQKAIELLCEQIDEVRTANGRLARLVEDLAKMLQDEEPSIRAFVRFMNEWGGNSDVFDGKSKLQLIAERVVHYDARIAELHKRLDEWDTFKKRLNETMESIDRVFKGGTL